MNKRSVLIACTGNSCRSQMAEGIWRHLAGDHWAVFSGGSRPSGFVRPLAIRALAELGIDISGQESRSLSAFADQVFDLYATVCDNAAHDCPVFPSARQVVHWPLDDPAAAAGSEDEQMTLFRRTRDELCARIERWLAA